MCLGVIGTLLFCHAVVVFNTFTLKAGLRNFRFRRLLYGNLTGRRRAEHRQRTSGDAVVRYRPLESETGPAGPPSLHGGGPERAVGWYGRGPRPGNHPKKPVQIASPEGRRWEGDAGGWRTGVRERRRAASDLRRPALTDGSVRFRAAEIRMPPSHPPTRPRQPTAELLKPFNAQNSANYGEDKVDVAELLSWINITIIA